MLRTLKGPLALFLLCLASRSLWAAEARADRGVITVNSVVVLRMRAAHLGLDSTTRAEVAASAISVADEKQPVRLEQGPTGYQVFIGTMPVFAVTKLDAKANQTALPDLARTWAVKLSAALALPPVRLSSTNLVLPVGGKRLITMVGSRATLAKVTASNDNVTAVRTDKGIEVRAVAIGTGTVVVDAEGYVEPITISVRPSAATFPQNLTAEVVGQPAAGRSVAGAIETALKQQLKGLPFAKMIYTIPEGVQIPVGEARTFTIPVKASAPEAFDSAGNVQVVVRNVPLPRVSDSELWYSNNPEVVKQAQPLFSATLKKQASARLLYHHVNAASYALFLRVQAVNESDEPARVVIMPGDSPPDKNPVNAGVVAGEQYFRAWMLGSGEVVTIPPRSTLPISLRRLGPGQTSSGLCSIRLIEGPEKLLIRTDSWPPFPLDAKWNDAIASSTPWREVGCPPVNEFDMAPYNLSEHVYPNPQKVENVNYSVGGRYGFVRIGQRAIQRADNISRLDGNFGVIYNIKGSVENPTSSPTQIEVVFEASAGYSGALFSIDGNLIRTGLLQPKAESQILKFKLPPGGSKQLNIFTLPLSGSSYPATITIRPLLSTIASANQTSKS